MEQKTDTTDNNSPTQRDNQIIEPPATFRPATLKEKALARYILDNPKATITQAYQAVYNYKGTSKQSLQAEASRTASRPQVKLEMAKYSGEAEKTVLKVMRVSEEYAEKGGHVGAAYAGTALAAAKDVLDRVHGKATQKTEVTSQAVTLNIDLSGSLDAISSVPVKP